MAKNNIRTKLGDRIREERTKRNLSQEQLAEMVGVNRNYIGMIERAERSVSLENVEKIAVVLNIKVRDLMNF